jgi:hypothetical protein
VNDYLKQRLPKFVHKGVFALRHRSGTASPLLLGYEHLAQYDVQLKQLKLLHDAGFFSNCTVTLQNLTVLHPTDGHIEVIWPTQKMWRNSNGSRKNLFNDYFKPKNRSQLIRMQFVPRFNYHGFYEDLHFEKLNPYIRNYFSPSFLVESQIQQFLDKYCICPDKTIGVCYRGTDKVMEVPAISPSRYLSEVKNLLKKHTDLRVLVQTDQKQVRDYFLSEIGPAAFYLEEMPVTCSSSAMHFADEKTISNFELGINLLAAVKILAQCKYLISHTGNVSLWIFLYRGSARNCCQLRPGTVDAAGCYDGNWSVRRSLQRWTRRMGFSRDKLN